MHAIREILIAFCALAATFALAACGGDPSGPKDGPLAGGVLATFQVSGEEFRVWTDDDTTIGDLLALAAGESQANIPNGRLAPGPGRGDHNEPWSWHMEPGDISMAELTVEVCDGRPSFVEENLDHWLNDVQRFCPWSAQLVEVEDFR